jgi:hypothetical protein
MTQIKLDNGTTIKTDETREDLRRKLTGHDRLVTIKIRGGAEFDINPAHVVSVSDDPLEI